MPQMQAWGIGANCLWKLTMKAIHFIIIVVRVLTADLAGLCNETERVHFSAYHVLNQYLSAI